MARPPVYLNFAFQGASNFWNGVAIPAQSRYFDEPTPFHAVQAAWPVWHVLEWVWHEHNPGQDTRNNPAFDDFRARHLAACPELKLLRDVTDASKHCGLARTTSVANVTGTGQYAQGFISGMWAVEHRDPLIIEADGTSHVFDDVLRAAVTYWNNQFR